MKTLPEKYSANGWNYKLVQRNDLAAIYSQSKHPDLPANGKAAAWEVVIIRKRGERKLPDGTIQEAGEHLPSTAQWGVAAWTCHTLERANELYVEITDRITKRATRLTKAVPS